MHLAYHSRIPLHFRVDFAVGFRATASPAAGSRADSRPRGEFCSRCAALRSRRSAAPQSQPLSWPSKKQVLAILVTEPRMLGQTQRDGQGHKERRFLHSSFINIMKSPPGGTGRGAGEFQQLSFSPGLI